MNDCWIFTRTKACLQQLLYLATEFAEAGQVTPTAASVLRRRRRDPVLLFIYLLLLFLSRGRQAVSATARRDGRQNKQRARERYYERKESGEKKTKANVRKVNTHHSSESSTRYFGLPDASTSASCTRRVGSASTRLYHAVERISCKKKGEMQTNARKRRRGNRDPERARRFPESNVLCLAARLTATLPPLDAS